MQRDIGETISFEVAHDRLSKLKTSFNEYLGALRDCTVTRSEFEPLFCGVLLIRKPKNMKPEGPVAKDWNLLSQHLSDLCDRYAEELGENAYAVFNAMTEFASHSPQNRCIYRERHSFQRLAGEWLSRFTQECCKPDFILTDYLKELSKNDGIGADASIEAVGRRRL